MTDLHRIAKAIGESHDIILIAHINPDGDSAGSTFALYNHLKSMDKGVVCVCDGTLPKKYQFLNDYGTFSPIEDYINKRFDLCICVDCADISRLGATKPLYEASRTTANIDHHITNPLYADLNYVLSASSTGELMFELLTCLNCKFDAVISKLIYTALSTDTGNFTYSNTTPKSLSILSQIVKNYDHASFARFLHQTRSASDTRLISKVIDHMELFDEGRICTSYLTAGEIEHFDKPDFETAITFLIDIDTVDIALFFRQITGNSHKVSLRSKGDLDVSALAGKFGGGGHKNASGLRLNMPLQKCKDEILAAAREVINTP